MGASTANYGSPNCLFLVPIILVLFVTDATPTIDQQAKPDGTAATNAQQLTKPDATATTAQTMSDVTPTVSQQTNEHAEEGNFFYGQTITD